MTTQELKITGMTCQHCANAVTQEISALEGVSNVDVNLVEGGTSTATVTADPMPSPAQLAEAVDEAGYTIVG